MIKYERIAKRVQPDNKHFEGNNVLMNITPPRPYLIKKDDEERINAETESLLKEGKIKEYNSKMEEAKVYRLYFDEAYKYTIFYEGGDE